MSNRLARYVLVMIPFLLFAGCEQETIHTYEAPIAKPLVSSSPRSMAPTAPPEPTRMLAAILPAGETTWFFKLTAPPAQAVAFREEFAKFVASTKLENGTPSWEIPENWVEEPGRAMRFTTYRLGQDGPELSISTLPSGSDADEFGLANINRWRGQLGLGDLTMEAYRNEKVEDGSGELVSIQTPAGKAILIDFVGEMSPSGGPPFAGGMGGAQAPRQQASARGKSSAPQSSPPEHWTQGRLNSFRVAAFEAGEGEAKAEITISSAGGDLLANVNRWRGQVKLQPWSKDELASESKTLSGDGFSATYVDLKGPEQTILGAIIENGGTTWFVKLTGPTPTAQQEQQHFERFVETLKF